MNLSATDLGTLGGKDSVAHAINTRGEIVGSATTADNYPHAALWQDDQLRDLGTGGGVASRARDINDQRQVVGSFDVNVGDSHYPHAFLWEGGVMRKLGTTGETESEANAINESGQIVGMWNDRPALWESGKLKLLPVPPGSEGSAWDVNQRGEIVGEVSSRGHRHAVLWRSRGRMRELGTLGGVSSHGLAINDRGQILGQADTNPETRDCSAVESAEREERYIEPRLHAVFWREGVMHDLGPMVSGLGGAEAINDSGQIVGSLPSESCANALGCDHAFLWNVQHD